MPPDLEVDRIADHLDRLYRAAWALCGGREDAEDLVQETCARVLGRRRTITGDDPLPYLMTVLRNTHVDLLRSRARRPQTTELDPERAESTADPVDALSAREVFEAIGQLPQEFREVVAAVDVAGLSYAEAAKALGVPQGTVMSRLYRGRARLADRLRD